MLVGKYQSINDIPENDFRRILPRFQPGNFETNIKLVQAVKDLADKKGCSSAQLAISWVANLSKRKGYPLIIPIPGSANVERVKGNGTFVNLEEDELSEIEQILKGYEVKGDRYPAAFMGLLNG